MTLLELVSKIVELCLPSGVSVEKGIVLNSK